jgi:hypothetical protein
MKIGDRVIVDNLRTVCAEKGKSYKCSNGFEINCLEQHGVIVENFASSAVCFRVKMDNRDYSVNDYVCRLDESELRLEKSKELI